MLVFNGLAHGTQNTQIIDYQCETSPTQRNLNPTIHSFTKNTS